MNVLALVADFQRLAVVALAVANVAGDVNIGQEMHLNSYDAVSLAGLAASSLDVERKTPRCVAACPRFGYAGEQLADRRQEAGVGGRIGAWSAPDR